MTPHQHLVCCSTSISPWRWFSRKGRFDDAHARVERAKSHAVDQHSTYLLACAMCLQARFLYGQRTLEEAKSEALRATNLFDKLGAAKNVEYTKILLQQIGRDAREEMGGLVARGWSDDDGELFKTPHVFIDSLCSDRVTKSEC